MNWAILDENKRVTSIVTSEIRPEGSVKVTEGSGAAIGYYWNGWTFDAPRWSAYEFLKRFTAQERAEIRHASANDDAIADFLQLATSAHEIIADDPVTVTGMAYLVTVGLITEARSSEILS